MATPVSRSSARKRNNDEAIVVVTNIYLYIGLVAKQLAISKLRHSFVIRASAFEAYPSRQARDLEAVKGLTNVAN